MIIKIFKKKKKENKEKLQPEDDKLQMSKLIDWLSKLTEQP
jgi:hypothetical protein